ncbi:MAG TPA: HlyD family type I secretion periplasmic adaptor subunit [Stellaceae bacterium]|nr:HlyD family type I secretion periplasmic adaptor subunit [Stellaceae bacterium]
MSRRVVQLKQLPPPRRGEALSAMQEFQSDAVEAELRGPSPVAGVTLYATAAAIVAVVAWASLSRVNEIVIGQGKVVTTASNIVVAPLETAVIRSIDVRVGELVHAGEPLAHLDPSFTNADVTELARRRSSLDAQIARDEAELAGEPYSPAVPLTADEQVQMGIARDRQGQYTAQLEVYDQRVAQFQAEIATRNREIDVLRQRLAVLQQVETMRKQLAANGTGSKIAALAATDSRLDVERSVDQAQSEIAEFQHQLDGAAAERQSFVKKWRQDLAQDLVSAQRDEATVADQLSKATRRGEMVVLRTPMDAVVLQIAPRSVGSVMREAETLFTLVPVKVPVEIEAAIATRDIGQIAVGDEATIKLEAYPYQQYGTLAGRVTVVSRDSFTPDNQSGAAPDAGQTKPFYKVRVALQSMALRHAPPDFHLMPGMTATAEIKVGSRRLVSYLLYPFLRGINESFREP